MAKERIHMICIVKAGWHGSGTCETCGQIGTMSISTYDSREDPPESLTRIGHGAIVVDGRALDMNTAIDGAYNLPLLDVQLAPGTMRRCLSDKVEEAVGPYRSLDYVSLDVWVGLHKEKGYRIGRVNDVGVVVWDS